MGSPTSTLVPSPGCERRGPRRRSRWRCGGRSTAQAGAAANPPRNGWKMPSMSSGAMPTPFVVDADDDFSGRRARRRGVRASTESRSRPPPGIARRPLVARFQTIWRICAFVGAVDDRLGRHVDLDAMAVGDFGAVLEQARRVGDRCAARPCRRRRRAAASRTPGSCGWCRSADPTRAARCPSAAIDPGSAAARRAESGSSRPSRRAGCGSRARCRRPSRRRPPGAAARAPRARASSTR